MYWNDFGQPSTLTFRTDFNDMEFNWDHLLDRKLVKGRFCGNNRGWIVPEDMEVFAALYRKPLTKLTMEQLQILELIEAVRRVNYGKNPQRFMSKYL